MGMRLVSSLLITCMIVWLLVLVGVFVAVHDGTWPPSTLGLVVLIAFDVVTNYLAGERRAVELRREYERWKEKAHEQAVAAVADMRDEVVTALRELIDRQRGHATGRARPPAGDSARIGADPDVDVPSWAAKTQSQGQPVVQGTAAIQPVPPLDEEATGEVIAKIAYLDERFRDRRRGGGTDG